MMSHVNPFGATAEPTFDDLAEAALREMQQQQREQQAAIEKQITAQNTQQVVVPGLPAKLTATQTSSTAATASSATTGGRTFIRKAPQTSPAAVTAKAPAAAPSPAPRAVSASAVSAPGTAAAATAAPAGPVPHDPSALPAVPAAPAEESSNLEIAHLNESNVALLLSQQKKNASIHQHLTLSLQHQLESVQQQQLKLAFIRAELTKLDQTLSISIDTLRTEIELVGRQCLSLQTDFEQREKEYLEARKALAKAKQRKLLLTGHLDFIILSNEKEKAKKLRELERQLFGKESQPDEEEQQTPVPPAAVVAGTAAADGRKDAGRPAADAGDAKAARVNGVAAAAAGNGVNGTKVEEAKAQPVFKGFGDEGDEAKRGKT